MIFTLPFVLAAILSAVSVANAQDAQVGPKALSPIIVQNCGYKRLALVSSSNGCECTKVKSSEVHTNLCYATAANGTAIVVNSCMTGFGTTTKTMCALPEYNTLVPSAFSAMYIGDGVFTTEFTCNGATSKCLASCPIWNKAYRLIAGHCICNTDAGYKPGPTGLSSNGCVAIGKRRLDDPALTVQAPPPGEV